MGYYYGLIFLSLFAILENSVLIDFRLLNGQASLVLIAVIAWSWHSDLTEAIFFAFVGGIFLDILNPIMPAGVSVIAPLLMVFAIKTIERLFYQVSIFALIAFVAIGTGLHHLILFASFASRGINIPILEYFQTYSVPTMLFNLILVMPVYWFLRRFQKRIPQSQSAWAVRPR